MEDTQEQDKKQNYDWLKQYQFQKGESGNPGGRPKGKSLKTFAREILESMPEEEKAEFMRTLDSKTIWEMAEGKAKQDTDITTNGKDLPLTIINYGDVKPSIQTEELPDTAS